MLDFSAENKHLLWEARVFQTLPSCAHDIDAPGAQQGQSLGSIHHLDGFEVTGVLHQCNIFIYSAV